MTRNALALLRAGPLPAGLLLAALLLAPVVAADETTPPPPDLAAPAKRAPSPALTMDVLDLLPLGEYERQDFRAANLPLSQRLEGLANRLRDLEGRLAKREKKDDEESNRLAAQIDGLRGAASVALGELREALRPHGLTDAMIPAMREAPRGEGRAERYARRLVLLLPDLTDAQRSTFERVIAATEGAWLSARSLIDRTELALKQTGLEERQVREVLQGFRRQTVDMDRRFWRLVDYTLTDDQKVALWDLLPTPLRQHDTPEDHVYALPGLAPSQAARVKSLVTEIEAESAPDQALVRRLGDEIKKQNLPKEDRAARQKEINEANARLAALRRRAYDATKEILGPELVRAMKAIPPRVSINDRREDGRRMREGMEVTPAQEASIAALQKEAIEAGRRVEAGMQDLRKELAGAAADSPQQMMMDMMTAGARGQAMAVQRRLLGRLFLEILTPVQVDGWVMGLYGYRR